MEIIIISVMMIMAWQQQQRRQHIRECRWMEDSPIQSVGILEITN